MVRYYITLAVLALLAGCQNYSLMTEVAIEPIHDNISVEGEIIGEFETDEKFSGVDELLLRLRHNVSHRFKECGLESAYFIPDPSRQWGTLIFTYRFTPWKLGVQFLRNPEGTKRIVAIIRVVGTTNENRPDPGRLRPAAELIYQGMKLAGSSQN